MRRSLLAVLLVSAGMLAPVPGRAAAAVHSVDVNNNAFEASAVLAVSGDTVTWNFKGNGSPPPGTGHTVTAYSGATFDTGSVPRQAGDQYSVVLAYPAGVHEILYRCTIHSSLNGSTCTGMCGRITDVPPQGGLPVPTMTEPANGDSFFNTNLVPIDLTIQGGMVAVKIKEGPTTVATFNLCESVCVNAVNSQLEFTNGTHTISAFAVHQDGFYTDMTPAVTFTVSGLDTAAPVMMLDQPRPQVAPLPVLNTNPMAISTNPGQLTGSASDETAVKTITVTVTDQISKVTTNVPITCKNCGTKKASFATTLILGPGLYTVKATARDYADGGGTCVKSQSDARTHCDYQLRDLLVLI